MITCFCREQRGPHVLLSTDKQVVIVDATIAYGPHLRPGNIKTERGATSTNGLSPATSLAAPVFCSAAPGPPGMPAPGLVPFSGRQHCLQIGKGIEGGGRRGVSRPGAARHILQLGVLMLMAIGAEEFPIAAIRRVVVVIAVLVVDFEQLKIAVRKRAGTAPAHPGKELERLRPISLSTLLGVASRFENNLVQSAAWFFHRNLARVICLGFGRQLTTKS